jgi:hypothetical protein
MMAKPAADCERSHSLSAHVRERHGQTSISLVWSVVVGIAMAQRSPIQMIVCELCRQPTVFLSQAEQHFSGLPVFLIGGLHFKRLCAPHKLPP